MFWLTLWPRCNRCDVLAVTPDMRFAERQSGLNIKGKNHSCHASHVVRNAHGGESNMYKLLVTRYKTRGYLTKYKNKCGDNIKKDVKIFVKI